jgi:hypothetical protein
MVSHVLICNCNSAYCTQTKLRYFEKIIGVPVDDVVSGVGPMLSGFVHSAAGCLDVVVGVDSGYFEGGLLILQR